MDIAAWNDRKLSQWDRVRETLPGLQLSRTGRDKSTFILRISIDGPGVDGTSHFEDAVIFGRTDQRPVDINDATLAAIIETWRRGSKVTDAKGMPPQYDPNVVGQNYAELEPIRRAQRQAMQAARKRATGG